MVVWLTVNRTVFNIWTLLQDDRLDLYLHGVDDREKNETDLIVSDVVRGTGCWLKKRRRLMCNTPVSCCLPTPGITYSLRGPRSTDWKGINGGKYPLRGRQHDRWEPEDSSVAVKVFTSTSFLLEGTTNLGVGSIDNHRNQELKTATLRTRSTEECDGPEYFSLLRN